RFAGRWLAFQEPVEGPGPIADEDPGEERRANDDRQLEQGMGPVHGEDSRDEWLYCWRRDPREQANSPRLPTPGGAREPGGGWYLSLRRRRCITEPGVGSP